MSIRKSRGIVGGAPSRAGGSMSRPGRGPPKKNPEPGSWLGIVSWRREGPPFPCCRAFVGIAESHFYQGLIGHPRFRVFLAALPSYAQNC